MLTPNIFGVTTQQKSLLRDLKSIACEGWHSSGSFRFYLILRIDQTTSNRPQIFTSNWVFSAKFWLMSNATLSHRKFNIFDPILIEMDVWDVYFLYTWKLIFFVRVPGFAELWEWWRRTREPALCPDKRNEKKRDLPKWGWRKSGRFFLNAISRKWWFAIWLMLQLFSNITKMRFWSVGCTLENIGNSEQPHHQISYHGVHLGKHEQFSIDMSKTMRHPLNHRVHPSALTAPARTCATP